MRNLRETIATTTALILLVGCSVLDRSSSNPACEAVGSTEASEALRREVHSEPSPIEGVFFSCDYYLPGPREVLADLDLYNDDAKRTFQTERASNADAPEGTEFRDEDIGVPAYTWMNSEGVLGGALDGDRYYRVDIFIDRYGETPESAREAAVRLLQTAVEAED
jgi:hypothetical protein